MLEWIKIKNLALIESADVEFGPGLNAITGETGAGKTVIMTAVAMILGERASKDIIRTGHDLCEIHACFKIGDKLSSAIDAMLSEAGIAPCSGELCIKRIIGSSSGRNFINDSPCSLQTLKALGEVLIDTHGPHEHQSLLKSDVQLRILDEFGGLKKEVSTCRSLFESLKKCSCRIEELQKQVPSHSELEFLRTIVSETEKADLKKNEDEELSARHKVSAASHDLIKIASSAVGLIEDSESGLVEKLTSLFRILRELRKDDPENSERFIGECEKIREASLELSSDLQAYAEKIDIDAEEFARIEERLRLIQSLKRKYGPALADVIANAANAKVKLDLSTNFDKQKRQLEEEHALARKMLLDACDNLSGKRRNVSAKLAQKVSAEMKKLGFLQSKFDVEFRNAEPGSDGFDRIEFIFSANPGEKEKPLRETASSGEISRVMLALKTVLTDSDQVPVLIFDEIDVNIGGTTASIVGEELAKLARNRQILCITHLAQVAACADSHYKVEKKIRQGRTFTTITRLDEKEKIAETARMLGGTEAARQHAAELLKPS